MRLSAAGAGARVPGATCALCRTYRLDRGRPPRAAGDSHVCDVGPRPRAARRAGVFRLEALREACVVGVAEHDLRVIFGDGGAQTPGSSS